MNPIAKVLAIFAIALSFLFLGTPKAQAHGQNGNSIVDVALRINRETGEFGILIAALQAADPIVLRALSGRGQNTVFAPTDAAFLSLLDELQVTPAQLLSNRPLVTTVLLYHVVNGRRNSHSVLGASRLRTLQGGFVFQKAGVLTDQRGRKSNIISVDVQASNGIIHVIDRVILP